MSAPTDSAAAVFAAIGAAAPAEALALAGPRALAALTERGVMVADGRGFLRYNPLLPPPAAPPPDPALLRRVLEAALALAPEDPRLGVAALKLRLEQGEPDSAADLLTRLCQTSRMAGTCAALADALVKSGAAPAALALARGEVLRVLIAGNRHREARGLLGPADALLAARIALVERRPHEVDALLAGLEDPESMALRAAAALARLDRDIERYSLDGIPLSALAPALALEIGVLQHRLSGWTADEDARARAAEALRGLGARTRDPRIQVHLAYSVLKDAIRRGDVPAAEEHLARVRALVARHEVAALRPVLAYCEAQLAQLTGEYKRALAALTEQRSPPPPWQVYWPLVRATTRALQGEVRAALEESRQLAFAPFTAQIHVLLGEIEDAWALLAEDRTAGFPGFEVAMLRAEVGRLLGQDHPLPPLVPRSHQTEAYYALVRATLLADRGDLAAAVAVCEAGLELAGRYKLWVVGARLLTLRADLAARRGDRDAALRWLDRAEARLGHPLSFDANLVHVARAALLGVPPPREMVARIAAQGDYQSLALVARVGAALGQAARSFLDDVPKRARALAVRRFPAASAPAALVVHTQADWFRPPDGEVISLARYGSTRRVLAALTEARLTRPGHPMTSSALVQAGWPGERILPNAASTRMYSAIRKLRVLGIGDALETIEGGYRLSPDLEVIRVQSAP